MSAIPPPRLSPTNGSQAGREHLSTLSNSAASAKHDRFAAIEAWYGVYVDVLERLGWAGEAFAFVEAKSASGTLKMDRAALEVIQAIATGGQLAILVETMETLKKLGDCDRPIRIFDIQARQDLSGNFQIGAAQKGDNGAISVALGAFRFSASDNRGTFLFWNWGAEEVKFWTAVQKLTLNPDLYGVHRAAVVAKLKSRRGRLCRRTGRTGDRLRKVQLQRMIRGFVSHPNAERHVPTIAAQAAGALAAK